MCKTNYIIYMYTNMHIIIYHIIAYIIMPFPVQTTSNLYKLQKGRA